MWRGVFSMARYRLRRWSVGHYTATARQPAYAEVVLQGTVARGLLWRRAMEYEEQAHIELLPTDTADAKGSQALVRRAMTRSAGRWKGAP
jgi:hypothetical protein